MLQTHFFLTHTDFTNVLGFALFRTLSWITCWAWNVSRALPFWQSSLQTCGYRNLFRVAAIRVRRRDASGLFPPKQPKRSFSVPCRSKYYGPDMNCLESGCCSHCVSLTITSVGGTFQLMKIRVRPVKDRLCTSFCVANKTTHKMPIPLNDQDCAPRSNFCGGNNKNR